MDRNKNILRTLQAETDQFFKNTQAGHKKCGSYKKKKRVVHFQSRILHRSDGRSVRRSVTLMLFLPILDLLSLVKVRPSSD